MEPRADDRFGAILLSLSRGWIAHALGGPEPAVPSDPRLERPGATFVTLTTSSGQLHGCIGTLEPRRPLAADVRANALAAAFLDPRSTPLRARQLDDVCIEVSLLGPIKPLGPGVYATEEAAIASLATTRDGIVLAWGPVRGVLLAQVWEKIPDPAAFLRCLKHKAGLPADFWSPDIELRHFELEKWREERPPRRTRASSPPHTRDLR